jgi:hypothetical protein
MRNGGWMRRNVAPTVFALGLIWVILVAVLVARSPEYGAATPDALADRYARALRTHDATTIARLAPDGEPPAPAGCDRVTAVDESWLELRDTAGELCARLPIAKRDGQWIIATAR